MSPAGLPARHRFETALAPGLTRVSEALRAAAGALWLWGVSKSPADDVRSVISEFVANATEHGPG